jgi:ABC-type transporter Mla MlaB component
MQAGACIAKVRMLHLRASTHLGGKAFLVSLPSEQLGYSLTKPVSPESLADLRVAVSQGIAGGAQSVAIDVDDIGVLDSPVIGALISILRDARERGASVALRATRQSILDTLRVTALDKVFTIVSTDGPPPVPAPPLPLRARGMRGGRAVAILLSAVFTAASVLGPSQGIANDLSPNDIVQNVVAQNADMRSYRAAVSIDFALRSFPYVSQHLQGTSYYERPGNYEIVFDSVPGYAKGFDKLYTDIGDPSSWPRRFNMSLAGENGFAGHRDVVVRLVQKVRGMIDHEDVLVDPATWHVDEMDWHYYNGGEIAMSQEYEEVGGFSVLAKQHATIRIPFVHAGAEAVYRDYQTNIAIDDSVFTRTKHQ